MHYFITGHTGFKGSWLCLLLKHRGHEVSGFALDPPRGGLFERASVSESLRSDVRGDIRDQERLGSAIRSSDPDIVIHMAAQPLVRASYRVPHETIQTNVMGTLHLLETLPASVKATVVVTTDKVYRNDDQVWGYREPDPLGGTDPYSASKAMCEILTRAWSVSFPGVPIATARAGNVIGGGDESQDRLLPDLIRAFRAGEPAVVRNPDATRPWQHVLDPLAGYVTLAESLAAGRRLAPAYNFGPGRDANLSVRHMADLAKSAWGCGATWVESPRDGEPAEAERLSLDSTLAAQDLGWVGRISAGEAIQYTIEWWRSGESAFEATTRQVSRFEATIS